MALSAALPRGVLAAVLGLTPLGCKAKPAPAQRASASAHVETAPPAAPERCHALGNGASLSVGDGVRARDPSDDEPDAAVDEEAEAALPFAPRVDSALALADEFAAGGLTTQGGKTEAFVALIPFDGKPGRRVGLGVVHGDVDPPLVTNRGAGLVVAVADMDAGGGMLRLSELERDAEKARGELSITGVDHDAGAAMVTGERGALLVWGARAKRGVTLKAQSVDPAKFAFVAPAEEIPGSEHAEAPVLAPRPGGFWLAWIAEQPLADAGARPSAARRDAGPDDLEGRLVETGPRVLTVLPLDAHAKPVGVARPVSGPRAHVVGFAAALLADGSLSLTWREDDAAPGVESGPPELARVALDGAVQRAKLEDEELSAGLPALLSDPKPGGRVWVALESASEGTRVGLLLPTGLALETLIGDRLLRGADLLAAGGGRLLVGRNRGRAVELAVLECRPSP
jgi:hypothetical protein